MKRVALSGVMVLIWASVAVTTARSQPVDSALGFCPMHTGDRWVYCGMFSMVNPYTLTTTIVGDTVLPGGLKYWAFVDSSTLHGTIEYYWKRIDSTSGSMFRRDPAGNEHQCDSVRSRAGDHFSWE